MDLGGFTVPPARETSESSAQSDAILKAITDMGNSLAAFVAGKGAPRQDNYGGGGGKGPKQPSNGKSPGPKGGKGKGKGKGAADLRPGSKICHSFAETGRCPHMDKFGWCKFKHVRNIPKSLAGIDGLRFEDLGEVKYSPKDDVYTCVECDRDDKEVVANIQKEIEEIDQECSDLGFTYDDASALGFPRR